MKKNFIKYRRNIVIMDEATEYKKYLEALKKATEDAKKEKKNKPIKPIKAVGGVLAGLAAGIAPGIIGLGMLAKKKMKKASAVAEPNDDKYSMNNKTPITDLYQKTVKQNTANMYTGGEVEVTKGGDYIKDLID